MGPGHNTAHHGLARGRGTPRTGLPIASKGGGMVVVVGPTVLADPVVGWAIGKTVDQLISMAQHVVQCKRKCAALADTLGGQLRGIARDLDRLTQAEAFTDVRERYDALCKHLEEAHYVVLRCRQTGTGNLLTRLRMSKRIDAVQSELQAFASGNLQIDVKNALQQDRDIKDRRQRDATAAEERAGLLHQHQHPPLQAERGAIQRIASLREPAPQAVFQHLDALVAQL
jgi:Arabidopsis broad-spectrum mildew resistance protein RPW8